MEPAARASDEMRALQLHHAHQVCGIVAHSKDRGVASVAIRSLAIASCVLSDPREQDEVLEMLDKIHTETGWRLGKVHAELKNAWGWDQLPHGKGSGLAAKFLSGPAGTGHGMPSAPDIGGHQHGSAVASSSSTPPRHPVPLARRSPSEPAGRQLPAVSVAATTVAAPVPSKAPVNPLSFADFSLPNHPYQNWYEPPNRQGNYGGSQSFL